MPHESLRLYTNHETYLLEPVYNDPSVLTETLTIFRDSGVVQLNVPAPPIPAQQEVLIIYGIMGFIRLQAGEYMIVITNRERVGRLTSHDIFRVTSFQILPLPRNLMLLSELQTADEQTYVHLLESHLKSNAFYFSYTYDITHSLQRQAHFTPQVAAKPLWQRADDRFFWNRHISSKLIDVTLKGQDLSNFILPVIQGFIEILSTQINNKPVVFSLLSRRSRFRVGTRFFSRGIDAEGHVSNFVETEQLLLTDPPQQSSVPWAAGQQVEGRAQFSYVQTRGSVPVYWAQVNDLKYTPKLKLKEGSDSLQAARRHFDEQLRVYGHQILVNLTNTKGYELPMSQVYARTVNELNDDRLRYIHFDFHKECSKMRWHRIQLLMDQLEDDLVQQSFCRLDKTANQTTIRHTQTSVIRTNCMDCLDRTNVVQSTFARWVLTRQLQSVGILGQNEKVDDFEEFMKLFRNVWADNADSVSITYSGTGALKTDFTRTGARTQGGAVQDGVNSVMRYVKNNYLDGSRQDAFDLFLGNYEVRPTRSPFAAAKPLRVRVVPLVAIFAFAMLAFALLIPSAAGISPRSSSSVLFLSFWVSVIVAAVRFMFQHAEMYVDWPRLVPLPHKEDPTAASYVSPSKLGRGAVTIGAGKGGRTVSGVLNELEKGGEEVPMKKLT